MDILSQKWLKNRGIQWDIFLKKWQFHMVSNCDVCVSGVTELREGIWWYFIPTFETGGWISAKGEKTWYFAILAVLTDMPKLGKIPCQNGDF